MKRLHASGICDCCDGPPEDEGTSTDFSEEVERLESLRLKASAAATEFVFVPSQDRTPEDSAASDASLEETHDESVGAE